MNTIYDDLMERSIDIHPPTGLDSENADFFAHNTIVIAASAERVWAKPHCAMCGQRAAAPAEPGSKRTRGLCLYPCTGTTRDSTRGCSGGDTRRSARP